MAHGITVCVHVAPNVLGHVQVRLFSATVCELTIYIGFFQNGAELALTAYDLVGAR